MSIEPATRDRLLVLCAVAAAVPLAVCLAALPGAPRWALPAGGVASVVAVPLCATRFALAAGLLPRRRAPLVLVALAVALASSFALAAAWSAEADAIERGPVPAAQTAQALIACGLAWAAGTVAAWYLLPLRGGRAIRLVRAALALVCAGVLAPFAIWLGVPFAVAGLALLLTARPRRRGEPAATMRPAGVRAVLVLGATVGAGTVASLALGGSAAATPVFGAGIWSAPLAALPLLFALPVPRGARRIAAVGLVLAVGIAVPSVLVDPVGIGWLIGAVVGGCGLAVLAIGVWAADLPLRTRIALLPAAMVPASAALLADFGSMSIPLLGLAIAAIAVGPRAPAPSPTPFVS